MALPPPKPDHQIAARLAGQPCALAREIGGRFTGYDKGDIIDTGRGERGQHTLALGWVQAGGDQGAPTQLARQSADLGYCAGAEDDARSGGELKAHGYHPASSGKRLAYLTLVRGSAIMSATVSRQVL